MNFDNPWSDQGEDGELWVGAERMLRPCERCGTSIGVERHHIDHDKTNNDPMNIAFLCRSHHYEQHYPSWDKSNRLGRLHDIARARTHKKNE
jgi:hypothetical protein